jgi:signal transduction histidine kinase
MGRTAWCGTCRHRTPSWGWFRDDELREVLLNVMENARQAGANRIDVAVSPTDGHVEVTVRDDGDGVAADDLDRIFEPRFSTRTSGSGLGLAISRNMVEAWVGMHVERASGGGTVMHISLRQRHAITFLPWRSLLTTVCARSGRRLPTGMPTSSPRTCPRT